MQTLLTLALALLAPAALHADDAYPNAHLLLTTDWVAEHVSDAGVVVLDTRPAPDFAKGHVPGARSLPTSATFLPSKNGDIGTPEQIAKLLGALGVSNDTHIVLYDEGRSTSAARVFWTLETYGHARVSVVDGGFPRWVADGHAVSKETPAVAAVDYAVGKPSKKLSTADDLLEDLDSETCVMLDARSVREFESGRVPGAVLIEWEKNYERHDDGWYGVLAPDALLALYADQGVTRDKRVHGY